MAGARMSLCRPQLLAINLSRSFLRPTRRSHLDRLSVQAWARLTCLGSLPVLHQRQGRVTYWTLAVGYVHEITRDLIAPPGLPPPTAWPCRHHQKVSSEDLRAANSLKRWCLPWARRKRAAKRASNWTKLANQLWIIINWIKKQREPTQEPEVELLALVTGLSETSVSKAAQSRSCRAREAWIQQRLHSRQRPSPKDCYNNHNSTLT